MSEPDAGGGTSHDGGTVYRGGSHDGRETFSRGGLSSPSSGHIGRISPPGIAAPPTATDLAVGQRRLENRLDTMRADLETHQAEAHPRPLPNVVGSLQAQWQVMPAPIKQVIQIYGTMFLIALTVRFLQWFLATFRRRRDNTEPPTVSIIRQWPPQ